MGIAARQKMIKYFDREIVIEAYKKKLNVWRIYEMSMYEKLRTTKNHFLWLDWAM